MPGTAVLPAKDAAIQAKKDRALSKAHAKVLVRAWRVFRELWTWTGETRGEVNPNGVALITFAHPMSVGGHDRLLIALEDGDDPLVLTFDAEDSYEPDEENPLDQELDISGYANATAIRNAASFTLSGLLPSLNVENVGDDQIRLIRTDDRSVGSVSVDAVTEDFTATNFAVVRCERTSSEELTNDPDAGIGGPPLVADKRRRPLSHEGVQKAGKVWLRDLSLTYTHAEITGTLANARQEVFYRLADNLGHGIGDRYFQLGDEAPSRGEYEWIVELKACEAPL